MDIVLVYGWLVLLVLVWLVVMFVLFFFLCCFFFFFFFQAEDGIRDGRVTGVQTCALPIFAYVEATGRNRCLLEVGSNSLEELILWIGQGGFDFVAHEPPELLDHLRTQIGRASCRERV